MNHKVEYTFKGAKPYRDRYLCKKDDGDQHPFPYPFRRVATSNASSNIMSISERREVLI